MSVTLKHFYKFDPYILDVEERVLLRNGRPVAVTPKVFDTLLLLVKNQGCVVSKQKILDTLWPDVFVEESNITFNITMLRKVLGDKKREPLYIETVPRRGYRFKTEVKEVLAENVRADMPEIEARPLTGKDKGAQIEPDTRNTAQPTLHTSENGSRVQDAERLDSPVVAPQVSASQVDKKVAMSQSLAFALLFVLLIAGLGIWFFGHRYFDRERKRSLAQPPLAATALKFEQITNSGNVVSAAISPDGKQVAYALENSGQESLWLKQLATSVDVQIIPPAYSVYRQISFSHGGEYIYFVRHAEAQTDDIYRIPALGGPSTKLIPKVAGFSLSADDRQVAFSRVDYNRRESILYIANTDDSDERQLAVHKEPDWLKGFAWSPNGKVMVCTLGETNSSRQTITIVEIDVESGRERLLVKQNWFNVRELHWLPDGHGLLMCVKEKLSSHDQIWQMSYPGAAVHKVTDDTNNYLLFSLTADASKMMAVQAELSSNLWVSPNTNGSDAKTVAAGRGRLTWTPDGKIVYVSRSGVGWDVWLANADGTEPRQLTFNSEINDYPAVSPDGSYIVFHSDRTGADHLWRMNSDGSNQLQLTNGYAERNAAISPDGRWVYYNTSADLKLWKVAIEGGEPVKLLDQYALYPSVSPDGRLIAYYQISNGPRKYSITLGRVEDLKTVTQISLAPGSWISARLHWDAASTSVTYAVENEGKVKLYEQSLSGGPPRQVVSFKAEDEFDFSWSPDHTKLAYMSSKWNHDIVLIGGLK